MWLFCHAITVLIIGNYGSYGSKSSLAAAKFFKFLAADVFWLIEHFTSPPTSTPTDKGVYIDK